MADKHPVVRWAGVIRPDIPNSVIVPFREAAAGVGWTEVPSPEDLGKGDVLLSVGGDGTAMTAMRLAAITGANVAAVHAGTLGFLTEFSLAEMADIPWIAGECLKDARVLLGWTSSEGVTAFAANEFLLGPEKTGTANTYSFRAGGHECGEFSADAIMAATPTGSSAYSMSAGGAILHPSADVFQLTAVAPAPLAFRPVCVPTVKPLALSVIARKDGRFSLKADGIEVANIFLHKGDTWSVRLERAGSEAIFLRRPGWDFFDVLSTKLGWGAIPGLSKPATPHSKELS